MATATKTKTKKSAAKVGIDNMAAFNEVRQALQSTVKKGVVEDLSNVKIEAIPTGILGLDIATGIGGFPVGRVVELYGMESCGKSTVLYHLIAEAQKLNFIPIMIETEGSIDRRYMRRIGVDVEKVIVFSPDTMESAIDFIIQASELAQQSGSRALLMLDSVAALAPEVMMQDSAEKKYRGTQAGVWSQQMPKILSVLRRTDATLVLVNQMREPMDLYKPPSTPGGRAIKFAASQRVLMRRKVDRNTEKDSLDGAHGQEIAFVIEKNKTSSPFRKGLAYLPAGKRVDTVQDVAARGVERGVIEKNVKFEDGELVDRKSYFTIVPDDDLAKAIEKDLKYADRHGIDLPGTVKDGPYLKADEPISVRHESGLLDVLSLAPNLVEALRAKILHTLEIEAEMIDESPFEKAMNARFREFDADAEDGLDDKALSEAKKNYTDVDEEDLKKDLEALEEEIDDDLKEFATNA